MQEWVPGHSGSQGVVLQDPESTAGHDTGVFVVLQTDYIPWFQYTIKVDIIIDREQPSWAPEAAGGSERPRGTRPNRRQDLGPLLQGGRTSRTVRALR